MTIYELSEQYYIDIEKLQYFEENELIKSEQVYSSVEVQRLSIMCMLYEIGLRAKQIKKFFLLGNSNQFSEQIKLLNKQRFNLIDKIHSKQQTLDRLDYMIHELKARNEVK